MKRVSPSAREEIALAVSDLEARGLALTDAMTAFNAVVQAFNEAVAEPYAAMNEEIRLFNDAAARYNEAIDTGIGEIDDYIEDRSDRWREGERAQSYDTWKQALEDAKVEDVEEIEEPTIAEVSLDLPEATPPLALEEV